MRWLSMALVAGVFAAVAAGCATPGGGEDPDPALAEAREKGLVPVKRVPPEYPRRAALGGVQGCAVIAFDVMRDGRTDNYQVLDSKPQGVFVKAALLALRDWKFPEREAPIRTQQRIDFMLDGKRDQQRPECELDPELPEVYRVKNGG